MATNVDELRRIAQAGKDVDPAWYRMHRGISIHLTRAALALGLAPNQVSIAMMIVGIAGAVLLASHDRGANLLGFLLLYLAFLLDKVDGELARLLGRSSGRGVFLDRLYHRLVEPSMFIGVAVHEFGLTGHVVALVAGFATVVIANVIEENQHLAAYIAYKRMREGAEPPLVPQRNPSGTWARLAGAFRPLKGFRMLIVGLPFFFLLYLAEWAIGVPVPTLGLVASAIGLAIYLAFQCTYYFFERLDAEMSAVTETFRGATRTTRRHSMKRRTSGTLMVIATLAALGTAHAPDVRAAGPFYVNGPSGTCSDAGNGSITQPYCTIMAALTAHHAPGDEIRVLPGTYREEVRVDWSGTPGNPIRLVAQPGAGQPVVIEGTDDFSQSAYWVLTTGGAWRATAITWTPHRVFVDGDTLATWTQAGPPPAGSFKPDTTSGLLVNVGGGNPGTHQIHVGHRTNGIIVLNEDWIEIVGFEVNRAEDRGIRVNAGSTNVTVRNNTVRRSGRFGIQAITATNVTIAGNVCVQNDDHGITLTAGTTQSVVESNECWGNAVPNSRSANGVHLFEADRNTIRNNRLHDNQDTGLQFSMADSNVVTQNLSWNNGDHGYDHLQATGNTHVGDVAWGNFNDGFSMEGTAVRQRIYNCISVNNGASTGRYNIYVDSLSITGFESNDNVIWNSAGHPPIKHFGSTYATVAAFAAATGKDTRTKQFNPQFVNQAGGDFHLLAVSPAIDCGNSAVPNWPSSDAEGRPRMDEPSVGNTGLGPVSYADRGAYEFVPLALVDVPGETPALEAAASVWPNPVQTSASLRFSITRPGAVTIDVLDVQGRRVRRLLDGEHREAGTHVMPLEASDATGGTSAFGAGIYFFRVESPDGPRTGKFLVVH